MRAMKVVWRRRTRLRDARLALFERRLELEVFRELNTVCFAAGLQGDRLQLRGKLVDGRDGRVQELRVDRPERLEVGLLNVRGEDDVRDGVDAGDLLLHRRHDLLDGARQVDAGDELQTIILRELGVGEGERAVGQAGDFGEGGRCWVGEGLLHAGPTSVRWLEMVVDSCDGIKGHERDARGAEDEEMAAFDRHDCYFQVLKAWKMRVRFKDNVDEPASTSPSC